jgi:hypothetical protein
MPFTTFEVFEFGALGLSTSLAGSCGVGAQVILAVEPKFALDKEPLFWSAELG